MRPGKVGLVPRFELTLPARSVPQFRDYRSLLDEGTRADYSVLFGSDRARLAREIRAHLLTPPYCAVLESTNVADCELGFIAVACSLGRLLLPYADESFDVIRRLRPAESLTVPGWGVLTEKLHSDSTNWLHPHDVTLMACEVPDAGGGGVSLLLPLDSFVQQIEESCGPPAVEWLQKAALPWAIDPGLGGGVAYAQALGEDGLRWQLFRVHEAISREGAAIDSGLYALLEQVDDAVNSSTKVLRVRLDAGDILIVNNRLVVHARTPISAGASERVILHCKIALEPPLDHQPVVRALLAGA